MPPSDDLRESPALRQEGPQQEEPFTELEQDRVNKVLFGRVSERTRIRVLAALSASRTAQAPQQDRMNETTRLLDDERRRWYRALAWAGDLEGLAPEVAAEYVRDRAADELIKAQARIQVLETSVDYLRNLIDHPVKQWLPIETVPEGVEKVIAAWRDGDKCETGEVLAMADRWLYLLTDCFVTPTHWMTLPVPPVAPAEGEQ